jgi:hypothetical protein
MQESTENNLSDSHLPRNRCLQYGCTYSYLGGTVTDPKTSCYLSYHLGGSTITHTKCARKNNAIQYKLFTFEQEVATKNATSCRATIFHLCKIKIIMMLTTICGP